MKAEHLEKLINKLSGTPGINGRDEFLSSVVLVPLVLINNEYCFLFEKRSPNIRQGGEICFPGGVYDPDGDSNSMQTALRETYEEAGITADRISVLGPLDMVVAPMGTIVEAFLGVLSINSLDELVVNHDEVSRIFTVPAAYFEENGPEVYHTRVFAHPSYEDREGNKIILFPSKELGVPQIYEKPWGGRDYKVYVYRYEKEIIWGITARFIYDVVNKLK